MLRKVLILFIILMFVLGFTACNGMSKNSSGNSGKDVESAMAEAGDDSSQAKGGNGADGQSNDGASTVGSSNGQGTQTVVSGGGFVLPDTSIRPYAVMIDNEGTRPLPQGGLDKAQIIYEIIVEGGVTRLMPVFWGTDPAMIGPVRSSRHYFLDFAMEHDAIYVHIGWSPKAMKDIPAFKINNINGLTGAGAIFHDLTNDRGNWQDSYTSMKDILGYVNKRKLRTETGMKPVFTYNSEDKEPVEGQKAENINIGFSTGYKCGFVYDPALKSYLRFRQGQPQVERVTEKQLTAKNILIQFVRYHTIAGDKAGRQELDDVGKGKGLFLACGKAVEISWFKASRSGQTKYSLGDGSPVMLNPGQTWIELVYSKSNVSVK